MLLDQMMSTSIARFRLAILLVIFSGLALSTLHAQTIATASGDSGSGYPAFTTVGFGIEGPDESSPDCQAAPASEAGNHKAFGPHITQVADATLRQNVFAFVSHINEDSDRCLVQDRVRIEVKGGPQGASTPDLEHNFGDTSYYRWQFRLDEGFTGSSSFTHLFQSKAQGGANDGQPIITLTARVNDLEVIHVPKDDGSTAMDLAAVPLSAIRGKWVEVYMRQVHADAGLLEIRINDVATGVPILNYLNTNIDLWRETNSPAFINRPKWGIYRKRVTGLRDEVVRFANICATEKSIDLCPSKLPAANGAPQVVTQVRPIDQARNVPLTLPITWNPSAGATSYKVFFGTTEQPDSVATVSAPLYAPTLAYGTTYYYQISAVNASGETRSKVYQFRALGMADGGDWEVVRGHAAPHVEAPDLFELNTNLEIPPAVDSVYAVTGEPGNAAFAYFSGPKEGTNGNYRWRYRQSAGEVTTLVVRMAPLPGVSNIGFVEFYGLGWRQKVRINRSSVKFEKGANTDVDFPADFWEDGKFRILRFTFAPTAEGTNMLTTLYLDEASTAFASDVSTEEKTSNYIDVGRNGSEDYGSAFDYIAVNPTGAFAPDDAAAPALPSDLFVGGGGSNGVPLAVMGTLPQNTVSNVPLTMPLVWEPSEGATSYRVYFGTSATPAFVKDTTGASFGVSLKTGTTYYYQIGAVNDNGETRSEVQSFTTVAKADDGTWNVARGHAKPDVEVGQFFELDTNLDRPAALDTVIRIGGGDNAAFGYLSAEKEGSNGNYRWRYRQAPNDAVTLVLRAAPLTDVSNLFYVEFYGLGWRQKIRVNTSGAKFEKTPDDPEFDFPAGFWQPDTFRVLRFTFEPGPGGNMVTRMYLNESATAFGEGLSDEEKDGSYLDVGRAGGTDYGAYFDYLAVNPTGAFGPADAAAPMLPEDLIAPRIVGIASGPDIKPLRFSPNPVRSVITLDGGAAVGGTYRVYSTLGQVIDEGGVGVGGQIEVGRLAPGLYVLEVVDSEGEVYVGRVVKE